MKQLPPWLQGLNNPIFARLYLAQTINLIGDALTWLGLALLAFELVGVHSTTLTTDSPHHHLHFHRIMSDL